MEIAIYQCRGDLKKFNERYDVEEEIYECNWRTKLRKRFQENSKRTKECFEKYIATQVSKKEIASETLRDKYLRAMEETKHASEVLEREMKKKLVLDIDRLDRPNSLAIGQIPRTPRATKNTDTIKSNLKQTASITMTKEPGVEEDEHNFIVDINALRRWLQQNKVEESTETKTTGELVFHKYTPIMTMSAKEREVLDTVSVNLRSSSNGQAIVDQIEELIGAGDHKKTWMAIANRLDIPTRYKDCGTPPEYKNDGKTPKMNYQRLMEIDLMPMAVFHSTGRTRQEADDMASKCAMRYLQSQMDTGNSKKPDGDDETEDDIVIVKIIDAKERESTKHEAPHIVNNTLESCQAP